MTLTTLFLIYTIIQVISIIVLSAITYVLITRSEKHD